MKKAGFIAAGIIGGLVVIYAGVAIYFASHYLPNTTIDSVKCGGKTVEYVKGENQKIAKDYVLTITDRNGNKYYLKGSDFSYEYISSGEEQSILEKQNKIGWISSLWKHSEYSLKKSFEYDEQEMESQLMGLEIFSEEYIVKPEDAHIIIDSENYELVPEVMGNEPKEDVIVSVVKEAMDSSEEYITLPDEAYVSPQIFATDPEIKETADQIEGYLASTVHYEIEGEDENLAKEDILKLLVVGEDGSVTIDDEKLTGFVQKLATKYNTYGDVRQFKTSKGDTIGVGGGDYGWVINKKGEKAQLLEDLAGKTPVSREPVYEQRALQSGLDDIGDTYVEIDYTAQHMWFYKEGKLIIDTDIVSGNINRHNGSVDGVYKIVYKQKNATLVGEDYSSAVKYFMPFAYNIGIHDASWRSKFGGSIYKSSGSHGCVNTPEAAVKVIYDNIEVGTPVVAYYRETVKLTNNAAKVSNAYSYVKEEE